MKVRAIQQGFYGGRHIDPGAVFDVAEKDFADAATKFGWMEKIVEPPKEPITPAKKGWLG